MTEFVSIFQRDVLVKFAGLNDVEKIMRIRDMDALGSSVLNSTLFLRQGRITQEQHETILKAVDNIMVNFGLPEKEWMVLLHDFGTLLDANFPETEGLEAALMSIMEEANKPVTQEQVQKTLERAGLSVPKNQLN